MSESLVWRIRNHDPQAMRELYEQNVGRLASVCRRYVPAEDDAKDILQNSFVRIFTSISAFDYRDEVSFRAWMKKIVVNEALHFLQERRRLHFEELTEDVDRPTADEEPLVEQITPDELHQLIRKLPDGYRTVVNLFVFEGMSHRQIAQLLGIREASSASQFYHAKHQLGKLIKELISNRRP